MTKRGEYLEAIQYTLVKWHPDKFLQISWPVILPKCILYCYKRGKHLDLMIDEYYHETERFVKIWHVFGAIYYRRFEYLERLNFDISMLTNPEISILCVKHPLIMRLLESRIDPLAAFHHAITSDKPKMTSYLRDKIDSSGERVLSYSWEFLGKLPFHAESLEIWKLFPLLFTYPKRDEEKGYANFIPKELPFVKYLDEKGFLSEDKISVAINRYQIKNPYHPILKYLKEKYPNL